MPPSSLLEHVAAVEVSCAHEAMKVEAAPIATVAVAVPTPARHIHFQDADVIEFEPTLWTSTVASDGAPVGLSNKVRRRTRRRLDSWEEERTLSRICREEYMEHGYLEPEERLDILEAAGHALATVQYMEHETLRINRERWESNEHDLRYQYGLGEVVVMAPEYDEDEEEEIVFEQGMEMLQNYGYNFGYANFEDADADDAIDFEDDDEDMFEEDQDLNAEEEVTLEGYFDEHHHTSGLTEVDDMRIAMDTMDSYDAQRYEEWAWEYATSTDAMLADTEAGSADDEADIDSVPYPEELFGLHDLGCDDGSELDDDCDRAPEFTEMSTSPSDVARFDVKPETKTPIASAATAIGSAPYAIV